MKKLLFIIPSLMFLGFKSSAQQQLDIRPSFAAAKPFNAEEFNKHLGKVGAPCDTVRSLKIVNDTLTFLTMSGAYPGQKYTILISGNKISLDWANLKGKAVCVSGIFEIYKNQPQIRVAEPEYIQVR